MNTALVGAAQKSTMKLNPGISSESCTIPCEDENYITLNKKGFNLAHLTEMCNNFIPED